MIPPPGRVKPVLVLNKVDRLIGELQMEPEEVYQRCLRCIESVNALICTFWDPGMGEPCQMDPVLVCQSLSFGCISRDTISLTTSPLLRLAGQCLLRVRILRLGFHTP